MAWAVGHVLRRPQWLLAALLVGVGSLVLFVTFDRAVYLRTVVIGGSLSLPGRVRALASLVPAASPGVQLVRTVLIFLTAAAVGTNVALLGYQLVHNRATVRDGSGSFVGVVFATLGAGCASCGLAVVASALSLTGVSAGLTALPFEGVEFLLVALVVTVLSIHWVASGLASGAVEGCPVDL